MLRYSGRYRGSTFPSVSLSWDDDGEFLEARWRDWVEQESFKRYISRMIDPSDLQILSKLSGLVFHIQVHCSEGSLTTGTRMPVSCFELLLPLPNHRQLWTAKTSAEWKDIYLSLNPHELSHKILARQVLSNPLILLSLPDIYDSGLAHSIVLHCISSMIREYQQSQSLCESDVNDMTRMLFLPRNVKRNSYIAVCKACE